MKNPVTPCFRHINEVCSRFRGNRQTDGQKDFLNPAALKKMQAADHSVATQLLGATHALESAHRSIENFIILRNYSVRGHRFGVQPSHRNVWGDEVKLILYSVVKSIGHFTS